MGGSLFTGSCCKDASSLRMAYDLLLMERGSPDLALRLPIVNLLWGERNFKNKNLHKRSYPQSQVSSSIARSKEARKLSWPS